MITVIGIIAPTQFASLLLLQHGSLAPGTITDSQSQLDQTYLSFQILFCRLHMATHSSPYMQMKLLDSRISMGTKEETWITSLDKKKTNYLSFLFSRKRVRDAFLACGTAAKPVLVQQEAYKGDQQDQTKGCQPDINKQQLTSL